MNNSKKTIKIGHISLIVIMLAALLPISACAQNSPVQASYLRLNAFAGWGHNGQSAIITSIAVDHSQRVWVGTEDSGLWQGTMGGPDGGLWVNYTNKTGLADTTCTALLCDTEGRIWAGTLNHGVSVFNGKFWRNYDSSTGPLGTHIFALAENPVDHSVWMATENGISRYDQTAGTWSYFTKADGLPSNQPSAIAFDSAGTVYVGSQCDGIGISNPASGYKTWKVVTGPVRPTTHGGGDGLPSEVINAIVVAPSGTVFVATDWGLAETTDSGTTWHYIRGADWTAIASGEFPPPKTPLMAAGNATMLSDYATTLCMDQSGNLWVGHRDYGAEVFETATFQRTGQTSTSSGDFVTCIVPSQYGMLFGTYGNGVSVLSTDPSLPTPEVQANAPLLSNLPVPAAAPSLADLQKLVQQVSGMTGAMNPGDAAFLGDDWDTQGNWPQHYGKQFARVCDGHQWDGTNYGSDPMISDGFFLGPNDKGGDYVAMWSGAQQEPDNRSALYDPIAGGRGIYNWNDNAERYSQTDASGDLWYTMSVPPGIFRLSTRWFNNDGDSGGNRLRDHLEEIRTHAADPSQVAVTDPPLAVARVVNFRHAVYKSFVICGPKQFDVRLNRNGSFNTMIDAIFIDRLSGPSEVGDDTSPAWLHGLDYNAPAVPSPSASAPTQLSEALTLWASLDKSWTVPASFSVQQPYRLLAYRAALAASADPETLEAMRWATHTWTDADDLKFKAFTIKAFAAR